MNTVLIKANREEPPLSAYTEIMYNCNHITHYLAHSIKIH